MNGSDPRNSDTDGDLISDWWEIQRKSNITGIEGTPPQISNVRLDVGIDWDWWGFLYLPLRSHVTVSFDVSDNVGVARVDVKFIRYSGTETVHLEWTKATAPTSYSFSHRFDFSIAEALVAGADVNITAFDVNENGAWGDFHVKSVLEAIADAIAAFLSAIAKVIMEALSALANFLASLIQALFMGLVDGIIGIFRPMVEGFVKGLVEWGGSQTRSEPLHPLAVLAMLFAQPIAIVMGLFVLGSVIECAIAICAIIFSGGGFAVLKGTIIEFMKKGVTQKVRDLAKRALTTIVGVTVATAAGLDLAMDFPVLLSGTLREMVKGVVDVTLLVTALAVFWSAIKKPGPDHKGWAATLAVLGLAVSVLGNDLLGDSINGSTALNNQSKALIFLAVDLLAFGLSFWGLYNLLKKAPEDEAIDLLKEN